MRRESHRCSCGLAADSRLGHAYNEEAFRYLLAVQQRRAERSDRPFLLLLVDLQEDQGLGVRIEPAIARRIFASLWRALREADLIGWYREERTAGAVLTHLGPVPADEMSQIIHQRVTAALSTDVPAGFASRLNVRVCRIQPRLKS